MNQPWARAMPGWSSPPRLRSRARRAPRASWGLAQTSRPARWCGGPPPETGPRLGRVSSPRLPSRVPAVCLSASGRVVAWVPIDDLDLSSKERTAVVIGGTLALMLVLMVIAIVQARAIARPLENLVDVADALVRGEYRHVAPSRNHEVHALGQAVSALASQLERKLAQLTHQATHDPLSRLPNRKLLLHFLDEPLVQADGTGVAVLFLDLDNFKIVNESLGHAAGDRLILGVARRLAPCPGKDGPDLGARIPRSGGDEFSYLWPG